MLTPEFGAGPIMFRYWSGLYRKGKAALVVGNGTGNWFPLRVNAPAEIVEVTLRRSISITSAGPHATNPEVNPTSSHSAAKPS